MIRLFGITLMWPGEARLRRDLAAALQAVLEESAAKRSAERQLASLTELLQTARGLGFAEANGQGYQISPEYVLDYDERRTGGYGKLREITARVKFAILATDDALYSAPFVEFAGLRWKLGRAQVLQEMTPGYVLGRLEPIAEMGRRWVEVDLIAYADWRAG